MNAPFFQFGLFDVDTALIIAFFIGIGFGFFLEQAGFGSGMKLAGQFYFRDLTVFKVMFTAIITAMLGLFWLSWFGFLDLSLVKVLPTYFVPQLVGGLIFGLGFVMGGYCPGTCCVAAVTGKMDGWIHLLGMFAGIFFFGEIYPFIADWYNSTSMGETTLASLFNLPYGVMVFMIVAVALLGFYGAEKLEQNFSK
ncbi:MAG: YeeE/YedE family protein [Ignavibacteriales bacterium]|nr:YeeE/YedE family protein [Ignavibacteriales bacterium]